MSTHHRSVTDTELEILKALWELGEGTVREVLDKLGPQGRGWAYTTAQTLLNRLEEKGCVASKKRGRAFVFRPVFTRDELLGRSLDDLASRVCDGKAMPLLLNLVQSPRFSRREQRRFKQLLDELEKEKT
jgi:predicted transcriptional regulator